ncbi:MAG: polysaccharide export protein [Proteobacteria bacterium]|nr:polysaccharide export protein [Pseudomonadota bacterium]
MKIPIKLNVIIALIFLVVLLPAQVLPEQKSDSTPTVKTDDKTSVDSNTYIIGAEDVIDIFVWREESLTKSVTVRMDGKISLPLADDIEASGLTPLQLKEVITNKLKNFIDNPTVSVTVTQANSYKIYISGQVKNPGICRLRSETSFLQLIIMTGGFTDWADQKHIIISRKENGEEKRIKVNYKKIIEGKEPDIIMKNGDTVIVP